MGKRRWTRDESRKRGMRNGRSRSFSSPSEMALYSIQTYLTPPTHVYSLTLSTKIAENVVNECTNNAKLTINIRGR